MLMHHTIKSTNKDYNQLTHSIISVFRYAGISLMTGFPVNVSTRNSGIRAKYLTSNISSIRLCDKSNIDKVLQFTNPWRPSIGPNALCDKLRVLRAGNIEESQLSIVLI